MSRSVYNMDFQWKFHRGDIDVTTGGSHSDTYAACKAGNVVGPGGKRFKDDDWREVDLPHDFFSESEFSAENLHSHGYRERCNG